MKEKAHRLPTGQGLTSPVFELPAAFRHSPRWLSTPDGLDLIWYQASQDVEKAQVHFSENAVVLLLAGRKEVVTPTGSFSVKAGEALLIRKGNYLMSEKRTENGQYQSLIFTFSNEAGQRLLRQFEQIRSKERSVQQSFLKVPAADFMSLFAQSVQNIFHPQRSGSDAELILRLKLTELFWLLTQSDRRSDLLHWMQCLTDKHSFSISQLMERHFRENISLEQLAFLGGYSLSDFKRKFAETYATSPGKWLLDRRLEEAARLLTTTGQNVSEVGLMVGFQNLSHFIQAFRDKYGTTPKRFQQAMLVG